MKSSSPLQLAVFGLLILVFGIVDIWLVNVPIGVILVLAGAAMGGMGLSRYRKLKRPK